MAKLTVNEAVVKVIEEKKFILELTEDELKAIYTLTSAVTGSSAFTWRKHADIIWENIRRVLPGLGTYRYTHTLQALGE